MSRLEGGESCRPSYIGKIFLRAQIHDFHNVRIGSAVDRNLIYEIVIIITYHM